jgi:hypothetical protein
MKNTKADAVRQVLKEAGEHDRFFDYSDVERLAWMIGRAYQLGRLAALTTTKRNHGQRRNSCLPKAQTSR